MSDTTPSSRPQRGASPAQDADKARELAEAATLDEDADDALVNATLANVYAQLAQASLLSAILRELRFAGEESR